MEMFNTVDTVEKPFVKLCNEATWSDFNEKTNEMICTPAGRKIFPHLDFEVQGLNPRGHYFVALYFDRADNNRYKYTDGVWEGHPERTDFQSVGPFFPATGNAASGAQWMSSTVSFSHLKLSNKSSKDPCVVPVTSRYKYIPRVEVYRADGFSQSVPEMSCHIYEATFIAVTAYHNAALVSLKVAHNPYARGFRDGGHVRNKRRLYNDIPDGHKKPPQKKRSLSPVSDAESMESGRRSSGASFCPPPYYEYAFPETYMPSSTQYFASSALPTMDPNVISLYGQQSAFTVIPSYEY